MSRSPRRDKSGGRARAARGSAPAATASPRGSVVAVSYLPLLASK